MLRISCFAWCALAGAVGLADLPGRGAAPGVWAPGRPHPAVVRVITPQRDGMAMGSGTLVAVNDTQGLVLTNWHVVEGAAGPISVMFPDGFSSAAAVLKADRDWDLAALLIRRPHVEPVPLSSRAPQRGEMLIIAGYGSGAYRAAAGPCTQYVAPGPNRPFEMVELATSARQGDSGGPIFNRQGELAGVLFGTDGGSTTGSYCGRIRWFLASIVGDARPASSEARAIVQHPRSYERTVPRDAPQVTQPTAVAQSPAVSRAVAALPAAEPVRRTPPAAAPPRVEPESVSAVWPASGPASGQVVQASPSPMPSPVPLAAANLAEQVKTILAVIGLLAILFCGLRLLSLAQAPGAK